MDALESSEKSEAQETIAIGKRIKKLRDAREMDQSGLAALVEVRAETISRWETGSTRPRKGDLLLIARELRGSFDWLLAGEGGMDGGQAESQPIPTAIMTGAGEINPPAPGSHLDNLLQIQAGLAMAMRENQRQIDAEIARLRTSRQGTSGDPLRDQPTPPATDQERP